MRPMDTSPQASPYPRTYRVHRRARYAFRGIAFGFVVIVVIGDWLRVAPVDLLGRQADAALAHELRADLAVRQEGHPLGAGVEITEVVLLYVLAVFGTASGTWAGLQ